MTRKGYLGDVSDEEWAYVAPRFTLIGEDAPQRECQCPLRAVVNGLRYTMRTEMQWRRRMPNDLPPPQAGTRRRRFG